MKSITQYIYVAAILVAGAGCEDMLERNGSLPEQEYFFLLEYINYAWGYQHNGWIMDSCGNVRYYTVPEKWMVPDTDTPIEIAGIENYAELVDSVITVVDRTMLTDKVQLIGDAARGTFSEPEQVMADAGTWSYYALQYNTDQDGYERILLKQKGDWEIENHSEAAEELYTWMQSVTEAIRQQE